MVDCLKNILKQNPWVEMAKKLEKAMKRGAFPSSGEFVLDQDKDVLRRFKSWQGNTDSRLLLNLPPQPFIGSPKARIWILQFNPGYSYPIDDFDYLGRDELVEADCYHKNINANTSLKERIDLLCAQYRFENSGFYALDPKYHTFKSGFNNGVKKGDGTYLWYMRTLFPIKDGLFSFVGDSSREEFCRDNIFVLEFFPYHSKAFNCNCFPFLHSFGFWKELIHYGFKNQKIMLCHGLRAKTSTTACALASVDGFESAFNDGYLSSVTYPGKGQSRMILKRSYVCQKWCAHLDGYCNQIRNKYK